MLMHKMYNVIDTFFPKQISIRTASRMIELRHRDGERMRDFIRLETVTFSYPDPINTGERKTLDNISFEIASGEYFAIRGA